jgi:hypothetical protein
MAQTPEERKAYHKKWYAANRERVRAARAVNAKRDYERGRNRKLTEKYGITEAQYDALMLAQDGKCAICERHYSAFKRRFAVDHMHCSGKVRSLLCIQCNAGIGLLQDSPDVIYAAAKYVLKHKVH